MIASGLLLWSLKRQLQKKNDDFHVGHYLVNRLNTTMIIGLPIAMLGYLYANRFVQLQSDTPNYEVYTFFYFVVIQFYYCALHKTTISLENSAQAANCHDISLAYFKCLLSDF